MLKMVAMRRKQCIMVVGLVGIMVIISSKYSNPTKSIDSKGKQNMLERSSTGQAKWIFVHGNGDTCLGWKKAFPDHTIVIVAVSAQYTTSSECMHVNGIDEFIDNLSGVGHTDAVVAQDGREAMNCVQNILQQVPKTTRYNVIYSNTKEVPYNAKRHFGCGGMPYGDTTNPYALCGSANVSSTPVISIADERPCSPVYPPMVLDSGVHSLALMQCAWFPKSTFWTVPFLGGSSQKNDIAMTMLAEKLLWAAGDSVKVLPPRLGQTSTNSHSISKLMTGISSDLAGVSCGGLTFKDCSRRLSAKLVTRGAIDKSHAQSLERWLSVLEQGDYRLPSTAAPVPDRHCRDRTLHSVLAAEDEQGGVLLNVKQRLRLRDQTCKEDKSKTGDFTDPWLQYRNVLLIVTYNRGGHYDTIPYFETLYGQFFPHVIYCGLGTIDYTLLKNFTVSFMTYDGYAGTNKNRPGSLHYDCLIQASGMGYNVDGYLESSDDILMNMHRFRHYNTSKGWHFPFNNLVRVHTFNHTSCDTVGCMPDNRNKKFWHKFRSVTASSITELSKTQTPAARKCNANRERLYGGLDWHARIITDTTYTPSRYVEDVVSLLEIFARHKVYVEIAFPTVLHCIIPQTELEPIYMDLHNMDNPIDEPYKHTVLTPSNPGLNVLGILERPDVFLYALRAEPWRLINQIYLRGMSVFHAQKLGYVIEGDPKHVQLYCNLMGFYGDESADAARYFPHFTDKS